MIHIIRKKLFFIFKIQSSDNSSVNKNNQLIINFDSNESVVVLLIFDLKEFNIVAQHFFSIFLDI